MTSKINQAVIFCGGFGKRIQKYTKGRPKPLYKVNNKLFLEYLLFDIARFGIKEIFYYVIIKQVYSEKNLRTIK